MVADPLLVATVLALGVGVSFLSGLLGIGGGVVLTPLLLYVPIALGTGHLDMREVAGLTMVQGLFGAGSGLVRHRSYGFVYQPLVLWMGIPIGLLSLVGGVASRHTDPQVLLAIFAVMALLAALLMLLPKKESEEEGAGEQVPFPRLLAALLAAVVGVAGGLVGQGGAFIVVPLMLHVLRIPTRVTIGSSLGVVFCSAAAGFAGKLATGQIDLLLGAALVAGAIPGAQLGAMVSRRTRTVVLRYVLAGLIAATALKIWTQLLLP